MTSTWHQPGPDALIRHVSVFATLEITDWTDHLQGHWRELRLPGWWFPSSWELSACISTTANRAELSVQRNSTMKILQTVRHNCDVRTTPSWARARSWALFGNVLFEVIDNWQCFPLEKHERNGVSTHCWQLSSIQVFNTKLRIISSHLCISYCKGDYICDLFISRFSYVFIHEFISSRDCEMKLKFFGLCSNFNGD